MKANVIHICDIVEDSINETLTPTYLKELIKQTKEFKFGKEILKCRYSVKNYLEGLSNETFKLPQKTRTAI